MQGAVGTRQVRGYGVAGIDGRLQAQEVSLRDRATGQAIGGRKTEVLQAIQERLGSRRSYEKMEQGRGWGETVSDDLASFIAQRDSFYLGTASADGQPYIQHRGGKPGFLKVLDEGRLAFADMNGNRQYISVGNLSENDKAYIFLMDYPNRRRIKIWGRARVVEDDPALLSRLADDESGAPEHAVVFDIAGWDVNCPKFITPRFTEAEVNDLVRPLRQRIAELEAALAAQPATRAAATG